MTSTQHPARPLTSMVILTMNELAYTQRCIESIDRCTTEPHELVLVDNGSTDGTLEWLRALATARPDAVTVIENGRNLGFGGGCNVGLAASRGDRILFLNNDTVVTDGWLGRMHDALDADPSRGLVGPRSNNVADRQRIDDVSYDVETLDGLEEYATRRARMHAGAGFQLPRLIGFCILMRRAVVDDIGGFDLRFGLGNLEDDDLCLRAGVAGWKCWTCDDVFVHHFGSRTFAGAGIDYMATLEGNLRRFARKWNVDVLSSGGGPRGYDPAPVLATAYDPQHHYAPIVGELDAGALVELERRTTALLVAADRLHPADTRAAFRAACQSFGPSDDVTIVVRIDPRDKRSLAILEQVADEVGDDALPDIAVLEASDLNDEAALRSCDAVLSIGIAGYALAGIARIHGTAVLTPADLDDGVIALASRPAA